MTPRTATSHVFLRSGIALAVGVGAAVLWAAMRSPSEAAPAASHAVEHPAAKDTPIAHSSAEPVPQPGPRRGVVAPNGMGSATQGAGDPYDSASPAYDPVKLMMRDRLVTREIFEREERDPAFADQRESFLHDKAIELFDKLDIDAELLNVQCKTSSCQLVAESPGTELETFYEDMQGAIWGVVAQPSVVLVDGREAVSLHILFDPSTRNHDVFETDIFRFRLSPEAP